MEITSKRALRWGGAFGLAVAMMAVAPPGAARAADGLLLTSDYGNNRIRVQDLATHTVVYDLNLRSAMVHPKCVTELHGCAPLGMHYSQHDDRDFLTVATTVFNYLSPGGNSVMPTVIGRYELSRVPRRVWSISAYDFRGLPNIENHAPQGEDERFCDPAMWQCMPQLAHAIDVTHDDPDAQTVSLLIADAMNGRILHVTLDYAGGNSIATVNWAIGLDNPDWPSVGLPNGVRWVEDASGGYVMVTWYTTGDLPDSSAGALSVFHETEAGWREAWRFPEEDAGPEPYLQAVHMAQVLTDPTSGRRWGFYAHGRGLSSDWGTDPNTDLGGSMGVLRFGASLADPPVYYGEAVPFLDEAFDDPALRYSRDIEFMPNGQVIISDAACENFCDAPAKHFITQPFHIGLGPSDKAGYFSADHAEQDLIDLSGAEVVEVVECGHSGIFESHYLASGAAGRHLRRAQRQATTPCESQPEL